MPASAFAPDRNWEIAQPAGCRVFIAKARGGDPVSPSRYSGALLQTQTQTCEICDPGYRKSGIWSLGANEFGSRQVSGVVVWVVVVQTRGGRDWLASSLPAKAQS